MFSPGSAGDVVPYLNFAEHLILHDYDVVIITFHDLVRYVPDYITTIGTNHSSVLSCELS